ncbi:hypothetical protein K490DRAFT_57523 [Saccharata proteae CBS 121410]|uniref:F-box domain-containing protein n=1 Tax=Saccharata proteae CBS 121410 TaxID=1314787 RepID=A0A9P4HRH0_9PEZI|nr:hypothetical protein K490DRAFT_57523 [Saccharata proteae CBS 121410]
MDLTKMLNQSPVAMDFQQKSPRSPDTAFINQLPMEILEEILVLLPMEDLLFAQCICRHWHDIIQGSRLQRALYMLPDHGDTYGLNPLLMKYFRFSRSVQGELDIILKRSHIGKLITCENASWRKMYPVQPPESLRAFQLCYPKEVEWTGYMRHWDSLCYLRSGASAWKIGEAFGSTTDLILAFVALSKREVAENASKSEEDCDKGMTSFPKDRMATYLSIREWFQATDFFDAGRLALTFDQLPRW